MECARFLINHGAELNFTNIRGNTALHVATERGSKGIVLLYLLSGASPNIKNHEGFKPEDLNTNLLPLIHAVSRDRDHWGVLNDSYKARLKQIFDEIEGGDEAKVLTLDKCIKFNRFIDEESNDEVIRNDASEFIRDVAICRPGEVGLEE